MSNVTLTFIGTGDAFGTGGRFNTCFHVESEEATFLIDCGASTPVALKREGFSFNDVDAIVLSHLHGDHFGGIPFLLLDGRYISARTRPLAIAGPPGVSKRVPAAQNILFDDTWDEVQTFPISFVEMEERLASDVAGIRVTPFSVEHSSGAPAYALRIECGGKTIAFSGDTAWTDTLLEVARGADLFVCECNLFEPGKASHIDYRTLLSRRDDLECGRLMMNHLGAEMLNRRDELDIEVADDGMRVAL